MTTSPTNAPRFRIALAVASAVAFALCTCERPDPGSSVTELADPSDVRRPTGDRAAATLIDEPLLLALAQAKNFHHKAKLFRFDGKTGEAIAAVRQILSLRFPPGAPEAEDVYHDARALLAKLLIDEGQLDEAMQIVDQGLAIATRDSFFVANLHTVKGEIHVGRANQLGTGAAADAARRAAIEEFDRSIRINEALQKQLETP